MPKVLVVEDDPNILRAVTIRLKSAGLEVVSAQDAATAMTVVVRELPDIAILDISLPGGNGFQVAERIQAHAATESLPLIFLTASRKPGIAEQVAQAGAFAFIEKPYDPSVLLMTVEACLASRVGR